MILTKTEVREIDSENNIIKSRSETYGCPGERNIVATFKPKFFKLSWRIFLEVSKLRVIFGEVLSRVYQHHISDYTSDVIAPRAAARLARPSDRPWYNDN